MTLASPAASQEAPEKDQILATSIVKSINSPDIDREEVLSLFEKLRAGKFMMHGIKEERLVPSAMTNGIGNLSPEGGYLSFWNSGPSSFGEIEGNGHHETYGCCFFHYAYSYNRDPNAPNYTYTVAITNAEALKKVGIPIDNCYKTDSEMTIPKVAVPPQAIHFARIEIPKNMFPPGTNPRAIGQVGEAALFREISKIVDNFSPGSVNTPLN